MRKTKFVRTISAIIFFSLASNGHAFLHRSGKNIVDSQGKTFIIKAWGPGEWLNLESYMMNTNDNWPDVGTASKPTWSHTSFRTFLGKAMGSTANADTFYTRWAHNIITEADVAQYAGWGINALRISMNYHWFSSADGVYIPAGFALLDSVVAWGARYGVYVILAMHAAPGGQNVEQMSDVPDGNPRLWNDSATYQPWTIHLWTYIAQRYAGQEYVGGYDLFDEPIIYDASKDPQENDDNTAQNTIVMAFYKRLTAAMRGVDNNHLLFVESAVGWSTDFTNMTPFDSNMCWDFHDYNFDNASVNSYSSYYTLRNNTGFPLWNGEFGENNTTWESGTRSQCEANNIGWSWWTTKKIGQNTNPYTINAPSGFSTVLSAFPNGTVNATTATTAMYALAEAAKTANCTKNCGVVTALGLNCSAPPAQPITTRINEAKTRRVPNLLSLRALPDASGLTVSFTLPASAHVKVALYDSRGTLIQAAAGAAMPAGMRAVDIKTSSTLSEGVYCCVLYCNGIRRSATSVVVAK